jgi:AcrR family transcriptional regulator
MRRLADRIGYSTNYAYRYFSGRDDILLALVTDGFTRLAGAMRAAGPSLNAAATAYLDFGLIEPDLYQIMYGLGGVRVPAAATVTEGNAVGQVIADLLGADDPHDDRVVRIWATAHGLLALRSAGKLSPDPAYLHRQLNAAISELQRHPEQPS